MLPRGMPPTQEIPLQSRWASNIGEQNRSGARQIFQGDILNCSYYDNAVDGMKE